jgi:CRP-like cAMP-binding protein
MPLFASTAVIAVIVGLAMQEVLGNIFSGITLQVGKPFAPGDWVRSGTHLGRVQGIGWRSTAVITRANEKLEIPNSTLAKDILVNYSQGAVCDEISIGLSYAAPPNYARQVIQETLRGVPGVLQNPAAEILTWEYADFAVRYRIKYWVTDYADVERIRDAVNTSLWYALRRKSIEIPFPIRTFRMQGEAAVTAGPGAFEREITQELRRVDFLRDLPDNELRMLLPSVTVQNFGAGETIVRQGDQGDSLYMIRSGIVEVLATARDGQQVHIRDLVCPAFFGEMALMTAEPRTATVRARTDAELLQLNRDGFVELFKVHPEAAAQMGEVIALRMAETRELLAAAPKGDDARNRAKRLLDKMRSVFNLTALR